MECGLHTFWKTKGAPDRAARAPAAAPPIAEVPVLGPGGAAGDAADPSALRAAAG